MNKCYLCQKDFVTHKPEHVIPNCIGGKLKSTKILCCECNNKLSKLDKAFEDFAMLTNLVRPHRDNGPVPSVNVQIDGQTARILGDGNIEACDICVTPEGERLKLHYRAIHRPGSPQAIKQRNLLIKKIHEISHKYNWNKEKETDKIREVLKQLDEEGVIKENPLINATLSINAKGTLFPCILKIIVGYYLHSGLDGQYITNPLDILRDEKKWNKTDSIVYYYDWNISQPIGTAHVIYLRGDAKQKLLYGIFSLYNSISFIVVLNDNYNGPDIKQTYCYQLPERTVIPFLEDVSISREKLKELWQENSSEIVEKGFARFMPRFVKPRLTNSEEEQKNLCLSVYKIAQNILPKLCSKYKEINSENYCEFFIRYVLQDETKADELRELPIDYRRKILKDFSTHKDCCPYEKYMDKVISVIVSVEFSRHFLDKLNSLRKNRNPFFEEVYEHRECCLDYALEHLAHLKIDNEEIDEYYHKVFPQRKETYKQMGEEVITGILSPFIQKNT